MHGWNVITPALRWTDILHCNTAEALNISGEKDIEEAMDFFISEGVKIAVVSKGELGLVAGTENVRIEMPSFDVQAIDPTGAGDALCAGMIYEILQIMRQREIDVSAMDVNDLKSILLKGAAAGAACVTGIGTTAAVSQENVKKILKEHGRDVLNRIRSYPRT